MQREDVERLASVCCQTGHNYMTATEAPAALLALLDRAERAEAERDATFAAGQESMRERAAEALAGIALAMSKASTHPDADPERAQALVGLYRELAEAIRALPIKPRPDPLRRWTA